MDAPGGDADLRAEAELAAVAELRGGVPHRHRAVDAAQERVRRRRVLGDDGVGVLAAMARDMRRARRPRRPPPRTDSIASSHSVSKSRRSRRQIRHDRARPRIGAEIAAAAHARSADQHRQQRGRDRGIDQQRLGRAADAGAPHLGVGQHRARHRRIGRGVDIGVAEPLGMGQHRHPRLALHALHQRLAAARDDQVDQPRRRQHGRDIGPVRCRARSARRRPASPAATQPRVQRRMDRPGAVEALRPAAQDARHCPTFRQSPRHRAPTFGPALVDHADHPDRRRDAAECAARSAASIPPACGPSGSGRPAISSSPAAIASTRAGGQRQPVAEGGAWPRWRPGRPRWRRGSPAPPPQSPGPPRPDAVVALAPPAAARSTRRRGAGRHCRLAQMLDAGLGLDMHGHELSPD